MKNHPFTPSDRRGVERIGGASSPSAATAPEAAAPVRGGNRSQGDRFKLAGREEMKHLAKAEALVAESERCVSRQAFLIRELRGDGLATLEAEKSLSRLEAMVIEQRANRDAALRKAEAISEAGA